MRLEDLRVIHLRKRLGAGRLLDPQDLWPGSFVMDSCLRRIWIGSAAGVPAMTPGDVEIFAGAAAYAFLLSVTTGLQSLIPGETDVFGQFKQAWKSFEQNTATDHDLRQALAPWIQRLHEDTKEIRALFLQNVGGSSYGSLLRKLMRDQPGGANEPVLLVGAGQLALSVAPYLLDFEVWVANRSQARLGEFLRALGPKPGARLRVLTGEAELAEAWGEAAQAVLCVPYDGENDAARIEAWKRGGATRPLYHLGDMTSESAAWRALPGCRSLDDLFALEKAQSTARMAQLDRARRACEEKAKLRALGASISIPHGWEDLAIFA